MRIFRWFLLIMPIIYPFYRDLGFSMQEIMWLPAAFSLSITLMEIPSGYLGDLFGRKKSLVVGHTIVFLGYLAYCFSYGFWELLTAECLMGVGVSFISGSDSAMMYDTLKQLNKTDDYVKVEGRNYAIGNFSEAAAGIMGAALAVQHLRLPFYVQTVLMGLGALFAFSLIEPKRTNKFSKSKNWENVQSAISFAFVQNKDLLWFILFSSVMGCSTLTMAWYAQPYFEYSDIPLFYYGVLWAALNATVGIAAWFAHRAHDRFRNRNISLFIIFAISIGFIGTALSPAMVGLVFIFLLYIGRGIASPVLVNFIHERTPSEMRATVLSMRSFIIRIAFAALAPLLGYITDLWSLQTSLFLGGTMIFISAVTCYLVLIRIRQM